MNSGLLGGIIGSLIGVLGGAIGTYLSIKNTSGPKEKAFMMKVSIVTWITVLTFVALLLTLPGTYKPLLWISYSVILALSIKAVNRKQIEIRRVESDT